MIKKLLFILMFGGMIATVNAQTNFDGEMPDGYEVCVETFMVHDADAGTGVASLDGYTTYRLYVNCVDSTDRIQTVFGIDGQETIVEFGGADLFQAEQLGAGEVASDLSCVFTESPESAETFGCAECYYDSWVTIGAICGGATNPATDSAWSATTAIEGDYPWAVEFENGNDIIINDPTGGGWYSINSPENAYNTWALDGAGTNHQILLGQFTTTGTVSGIISFSIFPEGQTGAAVYDCTNIPFPCGVISGCIDETACNYDPEAVQSDNSCLYECELAIDEITLTNPVCPTVADGDIHITSTGGQSGLTYEVVGYATNTSGIFNNLFAANETYTVLVYDNSPVECGNEEDQCIVEQEVTFDMELLDIEFELTNPACYNQNNGVVLAEGMGGTAPYEYSYEGGAFGTENMWDGLPNGNYDIEIEDANGCQYTETATLFNPPQLVLENIIITNSDCATTPNGEVEIIAGGGTGDFEYEIVDFDTSSVNVFEGLGGGNYDLVITDSTGCSINGEFTITEPAPIVMNFVSSIDPIYCDSTSTYILDSLGVITLEEPTGGQGTLTVTWTDFPSGYTPTPSVSSPEIFNCPAGEYTVTVIDAVGCLLEQTFQLDTIFSTSEDCVVGIREFANNISLDVYPNPNNGTFNIFFEGLSGSKVSYRIVDGLGRTVINKDLSNRSGSLVEEINMATEANGFYYLQVYVGDEFRTVKIVKQD